MEEIWKDIPGYEDCYQASNFGNIRTKKRVVKNINGKESVYKEKKRKPSISEYRMIALSKRGYVKVFKISRIIASLFICGYSEKRNIVNHIDGNKNNDHFLNLEWCSHSENSIHAFENDLRERKNKISGIFFDKKRNKWCSYLYRDNKNIFIGRFEKEEDAIIARNLKINDYNSSQTT